MPSRRARLFGSLLALLVMVGLGSAPAQAAPPLTTPHARVLQFWTKDKIKNAKPRIMRLAASVVTAPPTSVPARRFSTGATVGSLGIDWTGGGAVQQTTGKVLFALGTTVHVCTGSVATDSASDRALVVTAAHCAYDNATQTFATNWMFVPDYDSTPVALDRTGSFCANTRFGCWSATALVAHTNFTSQTAFTSQASMHDFAFAVLDAGGHNLTHVDAVVGSQPISLDPPVLGSRAHAFGYPAQSPYPGTRLITSFGALARDPQNLNRTYRLASTMKGGASGGPWFAPLATATGSGAIVSVGSYGYTGMNVLHGPVFNAATADLLAAATSTSATGGVRVG